MHNISKGKGLSISNALCRSLRKCQTLKRIRLKSQSHENICIVALCLKITEKVSFNIASEASYVYILNGQKLIKNAENGSFWRAFENLKLAVKQCYQTGQFQQDKNWWKMPKFKNLNATFWVIFKQCERVFQLILSLLHIQ